MVVPVVAHLVGRFFSVELELHLLGTVRLLRVDHGNVSGKLRILVRIAHGELALLDQGLLFNHSAGRDDDGEPGNA